MHCHGYGRHVAFDALASWSGMGTSPYTKPTHVLFLTGCMEWAHAIFCLMCNALNSFSLMRRALRFRGIVSPRFMDAPQGAS